MEDHDSGSKESSVYTETDLMLYDTGKGYLVVAVRMEYHPDFEQLFLVEHQLVGFAEVECWRTIRRTLAMHGVDKDRIHDLPELDLSE